MKKSLPHVRITPQAHKHLKMLVPALERASGLNVSMTNLVSELILERPIPGNGSKPKATTAKVEEK